MRASDERELVVREKNEREKNRRTRRVGSDEKCSVTTDGGADRAERIPIAFGRYFAKMAWRQRRDNVSGGIGPADS